MWSKSAITRLIGINFAMNKNKLVGSCPNFLEENF